MTNDSRPRKNCKSSIGLHLLARSAAMGALSAILSATALSCPQNQSSATQAKARPEPAALAPGQAVTFELADASKHVFSFELNQGQYTTVLLDCPRMSGVARLLDSAGKLIDRTYGNERNTKERIEVV